MRTLWNWLVLSVLCIWAAVPAVSRPLSLATLQEQVNQQVQQQSQKGKPAAKTAKPRSPRPSTGLTARQQQITQALDKVRLKSDDPNIGERYYLYEDFKRENETFTKTAEDALSKWNDIMEKQESLLPTATDWEAVGVFSWAQKRPDYAKETKGVPFIYLTDASNHSTQSIVQEVKRVMEAVRKANPQARILLALEFGDMMEFSTPIRFAGKPNKDMDISPPYDQLVSQADKLNMDILSLDDSIWWEIEKEHVATKLGDALIVIPESAGKLMADKRLFEQYIGFLNMSTAGRALRNVQWTTYLNAAKPFYDIVIVYAGDGHIDSTDLPFLDIPGRINEKHVIFNFYTAEENQLNDEYRHNTYQMLCDEHACVLVPQMQEEEESMEDAIKWDGKSVLYTKLDSVALRAYLKTLPEQTQRQFWDYNKQKPHVTGVKSSPDITIATFDVALPNVNQ